MDISIHKTPEEVARVAAGKGAALIAEALHQRGNANIIVATGASQLGILSHLVQADIDWPNVTAFHLDEYIGLPEEHPASFRKYLKERFVDRVPLKAFHYVNGEADPHEECRRVGAILLEHPVDVAFIGIGENGHLAFNDPPADFEARHPYLVVNLDLVCRNQQYKEGWFPSLEEVPATAISMSVPQIMMSHSLICTVPGQQKANAVKCAVEGPVTPDCPASILQKHGDVSVFLDLESSSLIRRDHR